MPLTDPRYEQIQNALLAAFDEAGLRRLVKFELGKDLDQITPPSDLTQRAFNLIAWADKQGCIPALIAGALQQNPGNPDLQALAVAAPDEPAATPPYQGLAFFDVADAARFFGREKLTQELVAYLKVHRFLAVVGASGSGKSSVVRAGVVTALSKGESIQGSNKWATFIVTPTARPLTTLAAALTHDSESVTATTTLIDDMGKDPRSLDLFAAKMLSRKPADEKRLLLVIDQFEELFTLCKDKVERRAFVDNLLTAAQSAGVTTVVLTLRADFYAHCAESDKLRVALEQHQRYIGAMSPDELRAAIEQPAAQGGWDLEPGLVNRFLHDVADQPGALPLLSHALLETWKRRRGRLLTLAGYEEAGGVQGAIAHTAEATYAALTPDQQTIARNIFLRLTALGEGVQDTRRRVPLAELASLTDVEAVLQKLEDARLVTAEHEAEPDAAQPVTFVDVTHEALIREWPRLREWLAEDREGLRLHRKLTEAAQDWAGLARDPGALYRGVQLQQAQEWTAGHEDELNELERAFLAASVEQVEAARQREREQELALAAEQAKVRNRQRWLLIAAGVALVILVGAVVSFIYQNQQLAGQKKIAETNLELAQAELARQEGTKLLQTTIDLAASGNIADAITTYGRAIAADPKLPVDAEAAITGTVRTTATRLVQEGEALLREANKSGSDPIREQAVISASALFSQALALNPPPDIPVYVWIEPGAFLMGSSNEDSMAADDEKPQHTVWLDGYWIQRTEVTNEQYMRCVDAGVCELPGNLVWDKPVAAKLPVTDVDWNQAKQYAEWVGGRLPTEAEWEKACRGTDGPIYPWGAAPPSPELANYAGNVGTTRDVGSYPPGAHGLYDMAGNVWEWTADWYGETYYADSPERNPTGPGEGHSRTLRGGAWDGNVDLVRCANRYLNYPDYWLTYLGFRVLSPGFRS